VTDKQRAALLRSLLADAHRTREGYVTSPGGPWWTKVDAKAKRLLADLELVIPQLGPLVAGGLPTMLQAPTHISHGVDWPGGVKYPAFDTGFDKAGLAVLAVEALTVTRESGSQGGDAFYATGTSGIRYWYAHLEGTAPAKGTRFRKGQKVGTIDGGFGQSPGGPHSHLGIDVTPLGLPALKWGRDGDGPEYTFGSPTIGAQLAKGLA
jgi:murein DD-endopeptidase MepM/ murein hydrolase activator NlpD